MTEQKTKEKLRILAAGDTHGDSDLIKKLANKAEKEKVDLVILSGDITSPIKTQNIIKPFKQKNKKVLMIPGNHDSFATIDFLAEIYNVKNIHGYSVQYNGIGIFGAGGALDFNTTDREVLENLEKGHNSLKSVKKKIMITHMHPSKTKSEFSGIKGSKGIRKAIEKFHPDFLIHSHIHEAEGLEEHLGKTKIINVGRKGKIIEI